MQSLCPHTDPLPLGSTAYSAEDIIRCLSPLLTAERCRRIQQIVAQRTYSVVPVMEGLYDRGNVSAVIRSAEAMGYQGIHIIDSSEKFRQANRVTQGAEKWVDAEIWADTDTCVDQLRARGYRILATCFEDAQPISAVDFTQPAALVFGNEKDGVSPALLDRADGRIVMPMAGFCQSFNISVAAALCLYHAAQDRLRRQGFHGDLDAVSQRLLTASFYLRSLSSAEAVMRLRGGNS